jgi:hypothetical protein
MKTSYLALLALLTLVAVVAQITAHRPAIYRNQHITWSNVNTNQVAAWHLYVTNEATRATRQVRTSNTFIEAALLFGPLPHGPYTVSGTAIAMDGTESPPGQLWQVTWTRHPFKLKSAKERRQW